MSQEISEGISKEISEKISIACEFANDVFSDAYRAIRVSRTFYRKYCSVLRFNKFERQYFQKEFAYELYTSKPANSDQELEVGDQKLEPGGFTRFVLSSLSGDDLGVLLRAHAISTPMLSLINGAAKDLAEVYSAVSTLQGFVLKKNIILTLLS